MANEKITLARGLKQTITNVYRQYKGGTLHLNHFDNTVRISVAGKDQGILIFGGMGETICKLAAGKETCSLESLFEQVKDL